MANPLACAAANASLDLFESEPCLVQVEAIERQLQVELAGCRGFPGVVDVRGPRRVRRARLLALRLAARTGALAAVRPEDHLDLSALRASLAHVPAFPIASARPLESADNLSQARRDIY
jgi:acetylornithine/succinyldiaminopimelate/putrescine aminotransferase